MSITPAAINFTSTYETIDLELKLLTPMFGGGVHTTVNNHSTEKPHDKHTPIRGTAVRGALRHWWRATTGAWCASIEQMRAKEQGVFGGISASSTSSNDVKIAKTTPSRLQVSILADWEKLTPTPVEFARIRKLRDGKTRVYIHEGAEGIAYGAFPMTQGQNLTTLGHLHRFACPFHLHLRFPPEFRDEIKLAVSAFVHFGGVGGRTTRGFGQLAETSVSDKLFTREELFKIIKEQGAPELGDRVGAIRPHPDWFEFKKYNRESPLNHALNHLRKFRQAPGIGRRHPGKEAKDDGKPAGRSYWPEPDAIRRKMTSQRRGRHKNDVSNVDAFPRARFGLPILTHFTDFPDPKDTRLQPTGKERMRSPLQVSVYEDGYSYLVLTAPDARKMKLTLKQTEKGSSKFCVTAKLSTKERETLARQNPTLFGHRDEHNDEYDAVLAFLNYVKSKT